MSLIFAKISHYLKDELLIADSFSLEVCKDALIFVRLSILNVKNMIIAHLKNILITVIKFTML